MAEQCPEKLNKHVIFPLYQADSAHISLKHNHTDANGAETRFGQLITVLVVAKYWDYFFWISSASSTSSYLRDNRYTHVGHIGNDVTVLWWDVGMLEELAKVLLCHTCHAHTHIHKHAAHMQSDNVT